MSQLSVLLKSIVAHLALSQSDQDKLHSEIDSVVPALVGVALGAETPAAAIQRVALPLISDTVAMTEARVLTYVDQRLAGKDQQEAHASISTMPRVVTPPDPELISAAPTADELAAAAAGSVYAKGVADDPTLIRSDPDLVQPVIVEKGDQDGAQLRAADSALVNDDGIARAVVNPVTETRKVPVDDAVSEEGWRAAGYSFNPVTGAPL